jgi:hypothetical protein
MARACCVRRGLCLRRPTVGLSSICWIVRVAGWYQYMWCRTTKRWACGYGVFAVVSKAITSLPPHLQRSVSMASLRMASLSARAFFASWIPCFRYESILVIVSLLTILVVCRDTCVSSFTPPNPGEYREPRQIAVGSFPTRANLHTRRCFQHSNKNEGSSCSPSDDCCVSMAW